MARPLMMEIDIVAKLAKIGLTEYQIAMVIDSSVEYVERNYTKTIESNLPVDFMNKRKKRYYRAHQWVARKYSSNYKERRKNPQYRVECSMRSLINYHIKRNKTVKTTKTFDAVDYTIQELMYHLEKLFVDGMEWGNYGSVWHIDHKRPASWFKYETTDDEAFKKCWALDNLQPMFAKDNMSKGNRWEG